jgi:hypothetical protein
MTRALILSVIEDFRTRRSPSPAPPCQAIPRPAHDHERAPAEPERTLRGTPGRARTPPLTYPNRLNVRSGSDVGPPPIRSWRNSRTARPPLAEALARSVTGGRYCWSRRCSAGRSGSMTRSARSRGSPRHPRRAPQAAGAGRAADCPALLGAAAPGRLPADRRGHRARRGAAHAGTGETGTSTRRKPPQHCVRHPSRGPLVLPDLRPPRRPRAPRRRGQLPCNGGTGRSPAHVVVTGEHFPFGDGGLAWNRLR